MGVDARPDVGGTVWVLKLVQDDNAGGREKLFGEALLKVLAEFGPKFFVLKRKI